MASRVPLLLKNKGRKPTRLPIAPRAKPSNAGDRSKRQSIGDGATITATVDNIAAATPTTSLDTITSDTSVNPQPQSSTQQPEREPTVDKQPTLRAGGIAPGGSLASRPVASAVASASTTRSPVLPVQRASELRTTQHVERLNKISAAGPAYRSIAPPANKSPVGGARPLPPPAINTTTDHATNKRLVRKLDIKPHQSPRRAAQLATLTHVPAMPALPSAAVMTQSIASKTKATPQIPKTATLKSTNKKQLNAPTTKRQSLAKQRINNNKPANATSTRRSLRRTVHKARYNDANATTSDATESDNDDLFIDDATFQHVEEPAAAAADDEEDEDEDAADADDDADVDIPVYVPARERATMWAKSVLKQAQADDSDDENALSDAPTDSTKPNVVPKTHLGKRTRTSTPTKPRKKVSPKPKPAALDDVFPKAPSQMTMGELALTVPKGRKNNRNEFEVAASAAELHALLAATGASSNLNPHAIQRMRSFSVSSESTALGGSIVTPQVEIIDGQMVILESTIALRDVGRNTADEQHGMQQQLQRSNRFYAQPQAPGKRWAKDETKQFYYCLSQVGPNFSMMATLFPNRKRKELKCKFKYEEKHHAALIEIALKASTAPLDSEMVDVIGQMVDKDTKKKAKAKAKAAAHSTAAASSSSTHGDDASPSVAERGDEGEGGEEEFVDEFDDFYPRERTNSFDFAG